jgi:hypothetical protein
MDEATLAATRRTLHGIAECVLAGPQHRRTGELALRQTPGGFATIAEPDLRVDGRELVVDGARRIPLAGTFDFLAQAAGVEFGEAADLYHDHAGVGPDDDVSLDDQAVRMITDWYAVGADALAAFAPDLPARLWPEHFDLAVDLDAATYGVSPGDTYHSMPYAYVSATVPAPDAFWNAPFGAIRAADELPTPDAVVDFWRAGRRRLSPG